MNRRHFLQGLLALASAAALPKRTYFDMGRGLWMPGTEIGPDEYGWYYLGRPCVSSYGGQSYLCTNTEFGLVGDIYRPAEYRPAEEGEERYIRVTFTPAGPPRPQVIMYDED